MRLFGTFAFKDVLGERPDISEIRKRLEAEFESAIRSLDAMEREDLERLLQAQLKIKRELDIRAGSMAVPHEKVELFTELVSRYAGAIRERLEKSK